MKHSLHKPLMPNDRYYVKSPQYNNCALCAIEQEGPMTQERVGELIGLCKMRIGQIEKRARNKIKNRLNFT